jgi:hypothetical protein
MTIEDLDYLFANSTKENIIILVDSNKRDKTTWIEPNEFQLDFVEPFKFVYGLDILDINLPRTMYTIENTTNSLRFQIGNNYDVQHLNSYLEYNIDSRDYTTNELIEEFNLDGNVLSNNFIIVDVPVLNNVTRNRKSVLKFINIENPPRPFVFDCKNSSIANIIGFNSISLDTVKDSYLKLFNATNNFLYASKPDSHISITEGVGRSKTTNADYKLIDMSFTNNDVLNIDRMLQNLYEDAPNDYEPKIYSDISNLSDDIQEGNSFYISEIFVDLIDVINNFIIYELDISYLTNKTDVDERINKFEYKLKGFLLNGSDKNDIDELRSFENQTTENASDENIITSSDLTIHKLKNNSFTTSVLTEKLLIDPNKPNCLYYIHMKDIEYLKKITFTINPDNDLNLKYNVHVHVDHIEDNNQFRRLKFTQHNLPFVQPTFSETITVGNIGTYLYNHVSRSETNPNLLTFRISGIYCVFEIPFTIYEFNLSNEYSERFPANVDYFNVTPNRRVDLVGKMRSFVNKNTMYDIESIRTATIEVDYPSSNKTVTLVSKNNRNCFRNKEFEHREIEKNQYSFKIENNSTEFYFKILPILSKGDVFHHMFSDILNNFTQIKYKVDYFSSFSITSPGIIQLYGERYVTIHCDNIESHLRGSMMYNDYSPGLALINLGVTGYSESRNDFVSVKYKEFHPIGKLNNLKFSVKTSENNLYDFKNVNWHMLLAIKYYVPKKMFKFEHSVLNPNYNQNFLEYKTNMDYVTKQVENFDTDLNDSDDEGDDPSNDMNDILLDKIKFRNEYLMKEQELRRIIERDKNLKLLEDESESETESESDSETDSDK